MSTIGIQFTACYTVLLDEVSIQTQNKQINFQYNVHCSNFVMTIKGVFLFHEKRMDILVSGFCNAILLMVTIPAYYGNPT